VRAEAWPGDTSSTARPKAEWYGAKGLQTGLATALSLTANLNRSPTPPCYLQDRLCTSRSAHTNRLAYLAASLDLTGSPAESWKPKGRGSDPPRAPPRARAMKLAQALGSLVLLPISRQIA
jgi:hypothetical protein